MRSTPSYKLRQFRCGSGLAGYPSIAVVSQTEVIVADWSGQLSLIRLDTQTVLKTTFVGKTLPGTIAASTLQSPVIISTNPLRCAVATRAPYAAVWEPVSGRVTEVVSEAGKVNAVGWLPFQDLLILGLGAYNNGRASLEFWSLAENGPILLETVALTGCCVDAISWDETEHEILAYSGLKTQGRGFLTALDARTWLPRAVFDYGSVFIKHIMPSGGSMLLAGLREVLSINRDAGKINWQAPIKGNVTDAAWDADSQMILASDGRLLRDYRGADEIQLEQLEDCCSLAALPNGGFVGVSPKGMIGVWESVSK